MPRPRGSIPRSGGPPRGPSTGARPPQDQPRPPAPGSKVRCQRGQKLPPNWPGADGVHQGPPVLREHLVIAVELMVADRGRGFVRPAHLGNRQLEKAWARPSGTKTLTLHRPLPCHEDHQQASRSAQPRRTVDCSGGSIPAVIKPARHGASATTQGSRARRSRDNKQFVTRCQHQPPPPS